MLNAFTTNAGLVSLNGWENGRKLLPTHPANHTLIRHRGRRFQRRCRLCRHARLRAQRWRRPVTDGEQPQQRLYAGDRLRARIPVRHSDCAQLVPVQQP
jgi:hypothetical protein